MRPRTDVVILGGGPAGCATAIALAREGLSTLVVERTRFDAPGPGETLMGDVEPVLARLGVTDRCDRSTGFEPSRMKSAWGSSTLGDPGSHGIDAAWGWRIDRRQFDTLLIEAAERAGALVYGGLRAHVVARDGAGWRVTLGDATSTRTEVFARYIVDATGRSAWVARRLGAKSRRIDRQVALVAAWSRPLSDSSLVVESAPDGWWYSASFSDSHAIAVYLTDADLLGRDRLAFFRDSLAHSAHTRERLRSLGEPHLTCIAADTSYRESCAGEGWLAVGDAAFAIDPLSGSGIRHALESGLDAGTALSRAASGEHQALSHYEEQARLDFFRQLRWRAYYHGLESRWPSSPYWQRRSEMTPSLPN